MMTKETNETNHFIVKPRGLDLINPEVNIYIHYTKEIFNQNNNSSRNFF